MFKKIAKLIMEFVCAICLTSWATILGFFMADCFGSFGMSIKLQAIGISVMTIAAILFVLVTFAIDFFEIVDCAKTSKED